MHPHFEVSVRRRFRYVVSMSTLLLVASACGSDPTGSECDTLTSLEIAGLQDVLLSGQSLQLTVDVEPSTCSPQVTWSASPGLTINQNGMITGDQIGGPFTITALAGGLSATGEVSVANGPAVADARWALAWLDEPATPNYVVSNGYNFSTGGTISSTRTGAGSYTLTFQGLAASAGQKQAVQVTAYFTSVPTRCRVLSTGNQGSDLVVQVRCHNLAGTLTDSRFDVLVAPAGSLPGRSAFLISTSLEGGAVPAATAYSSANLPIRIDRESVGFYNVTFDGLARAAVAGSGPESFQVSAYGEGTSWCKVGGWSSGEEDLVVSIRCLTASGNPADAAFALMLLEKARPGGKRLGFVWANLSTSDVVYTPNTNYNFNSGGTPNTAVRSSAGVYTVTWTGLNKIGGSTAETNLVSAYGLDSTYCQSGGWASSSSNILCFAPDGTPTNAQFDAVWIE